MLKTVCFGEILWDVFPTGEMPGGAPFNVAAHLAQFGAESAMISRVGDDKRGRDLLSFVSNTGVITNHIQTDNLRPTGTVMVEKDQKGDSVYDITKNVAWDFIEYTEKDFTGVNHSDFFIFGSLAARSDTSKQTLLKLMEGGRKNVFDVNLRHPFIDFPWIEKLLSRTHLLKMNGEEMMALSTHFGFKGNTNIFLNEISETFGIDAILLTLGAEGAKYFSAGKLYHAAGISVKAVDTTGSGDSFLAAFLTKIHEGIYPQEALNYSCAVGAWVATQKGAIPTLRKEDIKALMKQAI